VGRKNPAAVRFAMKFAKLAISTPFLQHVTLQISHGAGLVINRVGSIQDCQGNISGMTCREQ